MPIPATGGVVLHFKALWPSHIPVRTCKDHQEAFQLQTYRVSEAIGTAADESRNMAVQVLACMLNAGPQALSSLLALATC